MPFNFGDVVKNKEDGKVHIINEINMCQLLNFEWEYSTNLGAWYSHEDFKLVRKADEKSIRKLVEDMKEEYGDEW